MKVYHTLKPIYNENSKVLILGSMPSIISREQNFYYANPHNRFWKIMEEIFEIELSNNEEKRLFLLNNNIALWDTVYSCDINASYDSSIKNIIVNDIDKIINESKIKYIFCTGKKSYEIFQKNFCFQNVFLLSSPSSANASKSLNDLCKEYKIIKEKLTESNS